MAHRLVKKCIFGIGMIPVLLCALACPVRALDNVEGTELPQAIILWKNTKAEIIDPTLVTEEEEEDDFYEEEIVSITTTLIEDGDMIIKKTSESISYTATFGTHFYLHFMPDVAKYVEGAVVPSAAYRSAMGGGSGSGSGGTGGSGAGLEIGDEGANFEPPLVAALVCGGGYLACATLFKSGVFRYGRKSRS